MTTHKNIRPSFQFDQSSRTNYTIKCVKMGNKQSEATVSKSSQEELLTKFSDKVDSLEELLTQYSDGDTNNMESRQTNLGIFSIGVENSSNGSCDCDCSGFWGILKVLATILIGFIIFRCLSAYCSKRKVVKAEKSREW